MNTQRVYEILETVKDPEIPVLSVLDLGVVRGVFIQDDGRVQVKITPTYSGCPAMRVIEMDIEAALKFGGFHNLEIITVFEEAWNTDMMSDAGREKLKKYGIAPPESRLTRLKQDGVHHPPACPNCGSENTRLINQFGSTACKSLHQCNNCQEPFDYFKCHV